MPIKRNIDFMDKETYDEVQRLSNNYADGNKSGFVRMACMSYETHKEAYMDIKAELRACKRVIHRQNAKLVALGGEPENFLDDDDNILTEE